jgi:hypothetical protein
VPAFEHAGISDDHHCNGAGRDGRRDERMANRPDQTGDSARQAQDREGPHPRDARAGFFVLELPAALNADQQADGKAGADAKRLGNPVG